MIPRLKNSKYSGLISIYSAVLGWAFTGIIAKLIPINSSSIIFWRLLICASILLAIYHKSIYKFYKNRRANFKMSVLTGLVLYFHWIGFYESIKLSNVSIGVVCLSVIPFFTCFADYLITGKKLQKDQLILSILVIFCLVLIFGFEYRYRHGMIVGLIGAVIDAFYVVLCERLMKEEKPINVISVQFSSGLIAHTLFILIFTFMFPHTYLNSFLKFEMLGSTNVFWMIILALPCTLLAFYLALSSLRTVPAFTQTVIISFEPIIGIVLSIFFFNEYEQLSSYFYIGIMFLVTLVFYQTYKSYKISKSIII